MITRRYRNLVLIPVFFALFLTLSSCTKHERTLEPFSDFSTSEEEVKEITKTEEQISKNKDFKKTEFDFVKNFHIGYLAFDVADIYWEIKAVDATENYVKYRTRIYSRTNGTVDYFMGWISHAIGYSKVYDDKVLPERFRSKVKHKKKTREIELAFDKSGKEVRSEKVVPEDNRLKRPAVSKEDKRGTFDPISSFFEAHRQVKNAFQKANFNEKGFYTFTVPLYDGRRRTNVLFTLQKKKSEDGFIQLSLNLDPVAGYTDNELDKNEGSSMAALTVLLDPTNYLPVKVVGKHPLGTASANYKSDCNTTFEDCIKK